LRKFSACFSSMLTACEDWKVPSLVTPSDQVEDLLAEQLADLLGLGERVLDGVVEESGDDARLVQFQVREQPRYLERVDEVGLA